MNGVLDCVALDETHDASVRSWLKSANVENDFPLQNLPFTVFSTLENGAPRVGVGLGDTIIDIAKLHAVLDDNAKGAAIAAGTGCLNPLMAMGHETTEGLRRSLFRLYREGTNSNARQVCESALVPQVAATLHRPVEVAGFTDFFASMHHASNAGRFFRPDAPLLPNYKFVPVAYSGRAASVQVDTEIQRPRGQVKLADAAVPTYRPSARLDYEVELGIYIGTPSLRGQPISVREAWRHVFGVSLLNDWSARDIQAWEYQPLGPFLAKSFATSVAPWVVTAAALAPFRTAAWRRPEGDPAPLPHLADELDQRYGGLAVSVDASIATAAMRARGASPQRLSRSNSADLYWTVAQMLAHHTSNGSWLESSDLLGTGTISGSGPDAFGSLLELSHNGQKPVAIGDDETRAFLEDGDELTLRGRCERTGFASIGFGECRVVILPAGKVRHAG